MKTGFSVFLCAVFSFFYASAWAQSSQPQPIFHGVGAKHEMRVVQVMARLSGAEQICHPHLATQIRLCSEFVVSSWHDLSGDPIATPLEEQALPMVWKNDFNMGMEMQGGKQPPQDCRSLDHMVSQLPMIRYCRPLFDEVSATLRADGR